MLALGLGLALVLLRGDPFVASDQGVFLSVAGRMLDGDRLYADVFDNKDPLFFYTYAGAFWIGDWRGPFLLDAIWLALAGVAVALLARALGAPRSAVVASFFVYPLALAAGWYLVGLSMLAALAVVPLAPWLWLRRRFVWAGVAVALVLLLKLNLAAARSCAARRAARARGARLGLGSAPSPAGSSGWVERSRRLRRSSPCAASSVGIWGRSPTTSTTRARARPPTDPSVARGSISTSRGTTSIARAGGRRRSPSSCSSRSASPSVSAWVRGKRAERLLGVVAAAALASALVVVAADRVLVGASPAARVPRHPRRRCVDLACRRALRLASGGDRGDRSS